MKQINLSMLFIHQMIQLTMLIKIAIFIFYTKDMQHIVISYLIQLYGLMMIPKNIKSSIVVHKDPLKMLNKRKIYHLSLIKEHKVNE